MTAWSVILAVAVTAFSALCTGWLRQYALRTRLLDVPNARSSHVMPTPRGGGLSIVIGLSIGLFCLWLTDDIASAELVGVLGPGWLIAVIGLIDDRRGLSARHRFLVHVIAASWVLASIGFAKLPLNEFVLDLRWVGWAAGLVLLVWLLNLYNFMDGIDGMAGTEAVTVSASAALLLWQSGDASSALQLIMLLAASFGFLVWNWPPAKIFMGDVGSAFLGLVLGAFALFTSVQGALNLWVWLILLAAFIADATLTLLRRVMRGERWYEAHRSHAYQRASRRYGSHLKVTVAVGVLNLLWLAPLAWLATVHPGDGWWLTAVAYLPLFAIALKLGAGLPDAPSPRPL